MSIGPSKWHVFFVTKMYRPRAKRKMYVWTCTKDDLSCNLTCYNVQYVCIVFDWGNFYAERNLCFFAPTFLIRTFTVPSQIFAVCSLQPPCRSLSWNNWLMCSHAFCVMIWFSCMAHVGGGPNVVHQLNWFFMEWWKTQALLYTPVSVWSCFTLVTKAMLLLFCIKSNFSSFKLGDIWISQNLIWEKPTLLCLV